MKDSGTIPATQNPAPSASSGRIRRSRWESNSNSNPSSQPKQSPSAGKSVQKPPTTPLTVAAAPPPPPPAPPAYGFHNLERRTILLVDGTARSYFALPPDYPLEPVRFAPHPGFGHFPPFGHGAGAGVPENEYFGEGAPSSSSLKRSFGENAEFLPHSYPPIHPGRAVAAARSAGDRGEYLDRYGIGGAAQGRDFREEFRSAKQARLDGDGIEVLPSRVARPQEGRGAIVDVDPVALKRAFLKYCKDVNENPTRRKYLEDGKNGPLQCLVCGRTSLDFPDIYGLILHAYDSQDAELRTNHLGFHKALCVLVGWNYLKAPLKSKSNMLLSAEDAQANRDDLIVWPPIVIIHNTFSGRTKDGREVGLGNIEMDNELKELGFGVGKAKKVFGKEGYTGVTAVKFEGTQIGLKEAERLAEYFEKENHGRKGWERAEASRYGDDDKNPAFVKVDTKTGQKKRIFYGYLGTASDIDILDPEMKKKVVIKSRKELDLSD